MSQLNVKTFLTTTGFVPDQKHTLCQMANGKVAILAADTNKNGSGAQRVHVYIVNQARTSVALSQFWDYSNYDGNLKEYIGKCSMTIDSQGNLHIVYVWYEGVGGAESLRYRKLTYNVGSDTFSLGSEVIISAAVANRNIAAVDIDSVANNNDCPVAVASYRTGTTTFTTTVVVYNRQTGGTWVNTTFMTRATGHLNGDVCIAARQETLPGTVFQFLVTWNPGATSGVVDPGDFVWLGRATVGGAFVGGSTTQIYGGLHKNYNGGYRAWDIFWLSNDSFLLHCAVQSAPHKSWHVILRTTTDTNNWTQGTSPSAPAQPNARYSRFSKRYSSASIVRHANTSKFSLVTFNVTSGSVYQGSFEVELIGGATWKITSTLTYAKMSQGYTVPSTFLRPYAGERGRFSSSVYLDVATPHTDMNAQTQVRKFYLWSRTKMPTSSIKIPAENASLGTSTPDITVDIKGSGVDAGSIRSRAQIEISPSKTIASGVVTVTQPVTAEAYYGTTTSSVKLSTVNFPLSQGTWYVRSRVIDQFGGVSTWSTVRRFSVSHPPSAIDLSPRPGTVIVYNSIGSEFSWKFTDAYALDSQTAYQIEVVDNATQVTIADTGKISSTVQSGTVIIPFSSVDKNLDWYVTIWDEDDVSSARVSGGTVYLTQGPLPTIIFPVTDGSDVNTATPSIVWTPGLTGTKTQISYRVQLRNELNVLIHDSGVILSSATNYLLPPGLLRNGKSYSVSVRVMDSSMLDSTTSRVFDAVWTPPTPLGAAQVYVDQYDTHGFAVVRIPTVGMDIDILKFHVYRRTLDHGADWELIHVVDTTADFIVFRDYGLPAGVTSEYICTQVVDRFGDEIESSLTQAPRFQVNPQNSHYWLVDVTNLEQSIPLNSVTSDSYTPEIEEATYTVMGRGRQVEIGEDVGITGKLNVALRDRDIGAFFLENYNYLTNPNFEVNTLNEAFGWAFANTGQVATIDLDNATLPPGPGNRRSGRLRMLSQRTGTGSGFSHTSLNQLVTKSAYFTMVGGNTYFVSTWISIPSPSVNYKFRIQCEWRVSGTVNTTQQVEVTTDTTILTANDVLETRIVNGTLWFRVGRVLTVPTGVSGLNELYIRMGIVSNTGTSAYAAVQVDIEAATLTLGSNPVSYFSGDEQGGEWTGIARIDPSFTRGAFTARSQRQWILDIQAEQHVLYLRNPFGDIWPVHVSNIDVERIPGVSSNEFVDVGIPYLEIREDRGPDLFVIATVTFDQDQVNPEVSDVVSDVVSDTF